MLRECRLFRVGCSERNENVNNGVTMRFIVESWGPEGQTTLLETNEREEAIYKAYTYAGKRPTVEVTVTDTQEMWQEIYTVIR